IPLGNEARTTRAVSSGTPSSDRDSNDIPPHHRANDHSHQQDQRHRPARITTFPTESFTPGVPR
ncbi:hypothetical protein, partial [Streptomyces mirabilis]|uniref:hypothetical protein n=1 Tax=Streptomyces mirabilis TaxID=68239 RepID=UPI003695E976